MAPIRARRFRLSAWAGCSIVLAIALWLHHTRTLAVAPKLVADIQLPRHDEEIACPSTTDSARPLVLLVLGQSNAGNHGLVRSRSQGGAVWFEGRCYSIKDPLPGGTGTGGSIWSRLGDSLEPSPTPRKLLLIVLAIDATRISDWTDAGAVSDRLTHVLAELRVRQITVTATLWQQGEADAQAGTGREAYAAAMIRLIQRLRDGGIRSPVLLARSTRCHNSGSPAVREALAQVAQFEPNVFLGPNTDELGEDLRFDGCHLNEEGLQRAANAWAEALAQHGIIDRRR